MASAHPAISTLVQAARREAGLSQEALAQRVGVGRPQISRIESGTKAPSYEVLVRLATVLDLDLNLLKAWSGT